MIKKHLITCSVIWVLFIITKLFIFSKSDKTETVSVATARVAGIAAPKYTPLVMYNNNASRGLNFASEKLPMKNKAVKRKIRNSLRKHSFRHIGSNALHRKAEQLFPVIEPILKAYGIPDDFKYIPLVEAGLRGGTSPRGARGWWQFMPGTARSYGLKVGHGRDERLNLRKATVAACVYLRELYGEFDSWTLAAAAYNIGSIKLHKAIKREGSRNYFKMRFNRETGSYVYKIIAMKEVISKPEDYGYKNGYAWLQEPTVLAALN